MPFVRIVFQLRLHGVLLKSQGKVTLRRSQKRNSPSARTSTGVDCIRQHQLCNSSHSRDKGGDGVALNSGAVQDKHFSFTETEIIRQEVTKDEATYQGGFFKKVIAILKILKFNLLQIIFKFFLQ